MDVRSQYYILQWEAENMKKLKQTGRHLWTSFRPNYTRNPGQNKLSLIYNCWRIYSYQTFWDACWLQDYMSHIAAAQLLQVPTYWRLHSSHSRSSCHVTAKCDINYLDFKRNKEQFGILSNFSLSVVNWCNWWCLYIMLSTQKNWKSSSNFARSRNSDSRWPRP